MARAPFCGVSRRPSVQFFGRFVTAGCVIATTDRDSLA
jgi:hypothetical protein